MFQSAKPHEGLASDRGPSRGSSSPAPVAPSPGMTPTPDQMLGLQSHVGNQATMAMTQPASPASTGLPSRSGIESFFGNMDDAKVHHNSSAPAGIQAQAYAQGSDIHLSPGAEKHVPHEGWHATQQSQGSVKPADLER